MKLRFSLGALIILLTLVAIAVVTTNQVRQHRELKQLSERTQALENEHRLRSRAIAFLHHLDPKSESDMDLRKRSRRFTHQLGNSFLEKSDATTGQFVDTKPKLTDVDGTAGDLEVLTMANDYHAVPGWDDSINVLFDGDKVIDVVSRRSYTRMGMFDTSFSDVDQDGISELVFQPFTIDFKTNQRVMGQEKVYKITNKGFKLKEQSPD